MTKKITMEPENALSATPGEFTAESVEQLLERYEIGLRTDTTPELLAEQLNSWAEHAQERLLRDPGEQHPLKAARQMDAAQRKFLQKSIKPRLDELRNLVKDARGKPTKEAALMRLAVAVQGRYPGMNVSDLGALFDTLALGVEKAIRDEVNLMPQIAPLAIDADDPNGLVYARIVEEIAPKQPHVAAAWLLFLLIERSVVGNIEGYWDENRNKTGGNVLELVRACLSVIGISMSMDALRQHAKALPWRR